MTFRQLFLFALFCVLLLRVTPGYCQTSLTGAEQLAAKGSWKKAIAAFEELYTAGPDSVYAPYLKTLIDARKYRDAEKLVDRQMTLSADNFVLQIDKGNVYLAEGKDKEADEQYNALVQRVNGDDLLTRKIAKVFTNAGLDTFAIKTYERAIEILGWQNAFIYDNPLTDLYVKTGSTVKAIDFIVRDNSPRFMNEDHVEERLLVLLGQDSDKLTLAEKELVRLLNDHPDNNYLSMILTWVFTQKNDWDGALMEIEAVDARNKENGKKIIDFAHTAVKAQQYAVAARAFDDVATQGSDLPYYLPARSEKLSAQLEQLKHTPNYGTAVADTLAAAYDAFLTAYPSYYATHTTADYALLQAQYLGDPQKAIDILNKALAQPDTRANMAGKFKLQLGDYQVLAGRLWEASLTYSQVDKEFKDDERGEDARFRNAKLAYYMGDFDWAQHQLSILKAATSELIANDALYLSVLITENVVDSNTFPLQRFAYAGLLAFQNRDRDAETLLDSLNKAYPDHPLNDDILKLRSEIALKHLDYNKALGFLDDILKKYHDDVLGDYAAYTMAGIYLEDLKQPAQARKYYEQLVVDYPGSTYVQTARQKLSELMGGQNP